MKVCPKCFESNDEAAESCKECGAPLVGGSDASDQAVYQDLARANLLRMRGDMKQASDVCLSILRRFPNNPTAHGLLGDICADQGELAQAATWYEMALDLNPDSQADRQKLASVRERITLKESADAAQQIGVPPRTSNPLPYVIIVSVTLLAVATGAFLMGQSLSARGRQEATINTPVRIEPAQNPPRDDADARQEPTVPPTTATVASSVQSDAAILNTLAAQGKEKIEYLGVVEDPRGQSAVITVKEVSGEAPGVTATRAGLDFYALFPAFAKVTIRVMGPSGFLLVADLTQDAAKTAQAALNGGDNVTSQSQVALSQTWTPPHAAEGSQPGNATGG